MAQHTAPVDSTPLRAEVRCEYGVADVDQGIELFRSWADTWVAGWWIQPGQGPVFANVPAEKVVVVVGQP